jgi:hypothetical protein
VQGMTREKISDPGFHKHCKNRSFFACIDRKRGKDDIQLEGFNAYYSPRTDLKMERSPAAQMVR